MSLESRPLRVVLVWRGEPMEERVFRAPEPITIGTKKGCTFTVPESRLGEPFPLFRPSPDETGFLLTLAPGMSGKLSLGSGNFAGPVARFFEEQRGAPAGAHRQQPLGHADWGIVGVDATGDVAFFFQFIADGVKVGPNQGWIDRFLGQGLAMSALVFIALVTIALFNWEPADDQLDVDPPPSAAIAKILFDKPPDPVAEKRPTDPRRVHEPEGGASKRAAGKEGTIGNPEAKAVKTVIAQGPRDQIVKKVTNLGVLGMLKANKQSQALKTLLSDTPDASMTTALLGVRGATTLVGRGTGGSSTRGEGPGGGGTGPGGQLLGTGSLAIGHGGNGRGTGTGSGNGSGGHVGKELKVAVTQGTPSADGGLSKEQILKVVQSHAAAIQFCYEKELQRFPHLAGKVVIGWKVDLEGRVMSSKIDSSSLGNAGAESCMARQVKNWQFPRPNGVVCVVSFPFFFKGQ